MRCLGVIVLVVTGVVCRGVVWAVVCWYFVAWLERGGFGWICEFDEVWLVVGFIC